MSDDRNIDFVLRTVEKRDVRFIRLWFTDVLGNLKSFSISSEDLEEAFEEGVGFDGSSIEGFVSADESDMLAFPDATTFQVLPWRPQKYGVARMFCDVRTPSREPFGGDPRSVLQRIFARADERGYVMSVGPKLDYFYLRPTDDANPVPADRAGYFDFTSNDSATDLRRETTLSLEHMSIPVSYSYHSNAPSQNAIELRYAEAVTCADNIMTARLIIRQVAHENGLMASFMPKPFSEFSGSGMYLYESIFDHDGTNLFWGPKTEHPAHLSELGRSYVAGLLKYAPEFMLVTNPTVNSYKRLVANGEVPVYATWGRKNRAALVRVPTHKPGKHQSTRVELRNPDPAANPYLAIAASLAAGLRGIEERLTLPEESFSGLEDLGDRELSARGIKHLPRTLGEAIKNFDRSDLMREALGDHICDFMVEQKWREWDEYCSVVTDWERRTYYAGV
ncbi:MULTISPECIES: glutamine synthetase family protein [Olsenella]|uniref:glutamine synthetase family protein n=1 Tax=Olsenella TaxID=133925 RepID=UPI00071D38D9|nr:MULTISPECIES: glutamine synthetase family protein [Olsenella]OFK23573.1 glutamine synthetase [Olsenella sp. HMSC062G07]